MPEKGRRERVCVKQGKRREIQAFLNTVGRRQKQARGKKHKKVAEIKSTRVLEGKTRRSGKQVEGRALGVSGEAAEGRRFHFQKNVEEVPRGWFCVPCEVGVLVP